MVFVREGCSSLESAREGMGRAWPLIVHEPLVTADHSSVAMDP